MNERKPVIGIIGAGKISMSLSRHLLAAGYEVYVSSSRSPQNFALVLEVMIPGARGVWTPELIEKSDIIILALPLSKVKQLPLDAFRDKLVLDATNHWLEVDGHFHELAEFGGTSSQYVASLLPGARVVKAFNHLGYHDVDQLARPAGAAGRIAMALAGSDQDDLAAAAEIVDAVGFDPVVIGDLADTTILQGGQPLFGAALTAEDLLQVVEATSTAV